MTTTTDLFLSMLTECDEVAGAALSDLSQETGDVMLEVGKCYLIRTLTFYHTGRVVEASALKIVLEDAAWIPDTGRFADCLATGEVKECEPGKTCIINAMAIVDAWEWTKPLPRKQK